ncbi:MAG: glycosyltransferase [Lentisphaeria bacterium]|nr:glycosyltransferase [Lentisphaeria bacterium]
MKVSVAIAAYRGEKWIGDQLQSLVEQTRLPDEVVITDDSPDDATRREAERFSGVLPLRYVANPIRLGVTGNFNAALSLTTGDAVFLCDQDDVWYPDKIAAMCGHLSIGGAAVFCDSDVTDAGGTPAGFTHLESRGYGVLRRLPEGMWRDQLAACCRRVPAAGHDMALTRELLDRLLPLPDLPFCHDTYLGVAAAALGAWRIVPRSLGTFRRHGASASGAGAKMSWRGQWRAARESVRGRSFAWNAELFSAVLDRLPELDPAVRDQLYARMRHSRARAGMDVPFLRRLPAIWREICSGNYVRFGRGWKNVVQDLFFRESDL